MSKKKENAKKARNRESKDERLKKAKVYHAPVKVEELPIKPVAAPPAETPTPLQKALSCGCEVVDCSEQSKELTIYNGRVIHVSHFEKLCSERDARGGSVELEELFTLKPLQPKKSKKTVSRAKDDSPWTIARHLLLEIFKIQGGPFSIKELIENLTKKGWVPPATNNDPASTLHDVVNKLVKEGLAKKVSRGQYGSV